MDSRWYPAVFAIMHLLSLLNLIVSVMPVLFFFLSNLVSVKWMEWSPVLACQPYVLF